MIHEKRETSEGGTTVVSPYCLERASKMQGKGWETKIKTSNSLESRRQSWETGKATVTSSNGNVLKKEKSSLKENCRGSASSLQLNANYNTHVKKLLKAWERTTQKEKRKKF